MPDSNLTRLTSKNLVYVIKSAVNSDIFRHIYVRHANGQEFDALKDGENSCAYVTSGILSLVNLIDRSHATVATTLKSMQELGWSKTKRPVAGAVACWPAGKDKFQHIGFYIDEDTYMSNSSQKRQPIFHGRRLNDGREPVCYWVHPSLLV